MRILYLPYEIHSREFISYQYLGNEVIKAGVVDKVVIGDRDTLQKLALLGLLVPGVWYLKSAQAYILKRLKRLKKLKFKTIVQDAESVCDFEPNETHDCFMKPPITLRYIDVILTSLESETKTVKDLNPNMRVEKSGFLRFLHLPKKELLNSIYKDETNLIKRKYGNYIFIILSGTSSKFGSFNIFSDYKKHLLKEGMQDWHADLICEWNDISHLCFLALLDFIRLIIADKNFKIVIRPHPSEDKLFLSKLFKGFNDVFIDDNDSLHGSILASSKIVICPMSTTSFECALLEKETYCLLPELSKYENKMVTSHFVNTLSTRVKSAEELYLKIMKDEKEPYSIISERKNKAIHYVGLNKESLNKWINIVADLSKNFKTKSYSKKVYFNIQNVILIMVSYIHKYLIDLLSKDSEYIKHKLRGNNQIPQEELNRMYPDNLQEKLGNFYVISKKG